MTVSHSWFVRCVEFTGFGNGKGELSFNKLVTFTLLWAFVVSVLYAQIQLHLIPPWFVWSFGVVVMGAGFGLKGYLGGVNRRTETFAQTDTVTTTLTGDLNKLVDTVRTRRDAGTGVEGTP